MRIDQLKLDAQALKDSGATEEEIRSMLDTEMQKVRHAMLLAEKHEPLRAQVEAMRGSGATDEQIEDLKLNSLKMIRDSAQWQVDQGKSPEIPTIGGMQASEPGSFIPVSPDIPLDPMAQWEVGLAETNQEKQDRFRQQSGPESASWENPATGEMFFKPQGTESYRPESRRSEKPVMQNLFGPEKIDWSDAMGGIRGNSRDAVRMAGAAAGGMGAARLPVLGAMKATPYLRDALGAGAGHFMGGVAEEGVESAQDLQGQEWLGGDLNPVGGGENPNILTSELKGAVQEALFDYTGARVLKTGAELIDPTRASKLYTPEQVGEARKIQAFKGQNPDAPDLMRHQVPGRANNTTGMMERQLLRQTDRGTGEITGATNSQIADITDIAARQKAENVSEAGERLIRETEPFMEARRTSITGPEYTPEQGGLGVQDLAKGWKKRRIDRMTANYEVVDQMADIENPMFDVSNVQQLVRQSRSDAPGYIRSSEVETNFIDEGGQPIVTTILEKIPALPEPERFAAIKNILADMDPVQPDYRVLKVLRTELRKIRSQVQKAADGTTPQEYQGIGAVYNELSSALNSPTSYAPRYREAFESTNADAADFYHRNEQTEMQVVFNSTSPGAIINGNIPDGVLFSPVVRDTLRGMKRVNPVQHAHYQGAVQTRLLNAPNAMDEVAKIKRDQTELYMELGGPELDKAAMAMEQLRASPGGQVLRSETQVSQTFKTLIHSIDQPEVAMRTLQDVGGRGSTGHELARLAVFEDFLDNTIKASDEFGTPRISAKHITDTINRYQKNGLWRWLTPEDKTKMEGMGAMMRQISGPLKGSDLGASLETQKMISQLKDPGTFLKGIQTALTNKGLAMAFLSRDGTDLLRKMASGKGPLLNKWTQAISSVGVPLAGEWAAKEGVWTAILEQMQQEPAPQ